MRSFLAGIAVLPLLATGAFAQDFSPHGRIDEFGGVTVAPEAEDEIYNLGIGTSLDIPFTDTIGVQVDAAATGLFAPGDAAGAGTGTVTVYYRDSDVGYGAFASGTTVDGDWVAGGGLVGLLYTDKVTYFGTVEALDAEGPSDPILGGGIGGTYFLTPNTALTGQTALGFSTGSGTSGFSSFQFGGEYRFDTMPISLGANYGVGFTFGSDRSVIHSAQLSLSYHFGTSSLQDESKHGPGFPGHFSIFQGFLGF